MTHENDKILNNEEIEDIRKAAEEGDARAQGNLGVCYAKGEGVPQDYSEAVKWYRKAAEQGNALAQCLLALCYENADGVPQDYSEAAKWYRKAAEQGNVSSQYYLGLFYKDGLGVSQDDTEAAKWFRKSAEQGYRYAQEILAYCYYIGRGVPVDYSEATQWYRRAAEQGHASAQYNLGLLYKKGLVASKDDTEAVTWIRKAAERGHTDAQKYLVDWLDELKWQLSEVQASKQKVESNLKRIVQIREQIENGRSNIERHLDELLQVFEKTLRLMFEPISEGIATESVICNDNEEFQNAFVKKIAEVKSSLNSITKQSFGLLDDSLHQAITKKDIGKMTELLESGVNIESRDNADNTPLIHASCNNLEAMQFLVLQGANVNSYNRLTGSTSLHEAAERGQIEMMTLLLDNGADIESQNNRGFTPLFSAAKSGKLEAVKLLLERGANVHHFLKDDGWVPLHLVSSFPTDNTVEIMAALLDAGADIEIQCRDCGFGSLHHAVGSKNTNAVKFLLERGANVHAQDRWSGGTPLHMLASLGSFVGLFRKKADVETAAEKTMALLLDYGADINARNYKGATPLHDSSWRGKVKMMKMLLEAGADVSLKDEEGKTPLDYAIEKNNTEAIELLQKHEGLNV